MVQGTDNGKHEPQNAISVAQRDNVSIARSLLAVAPSLERCR
jgi:hypothetical protein